MRISHNTSIPGYKCNLCHDTGYIIEQVIIPEYDRSITVNVGEECPNCKGKIWTGDTGIPKIFSGADMSKFNFEEYGQDIKKIQALITSFWKEFETWEKHSKGLYLWSNTKGSGKSFLSCCLARSIEGKYRKRIKFITTVDYLQMVKESYKQGHDVPDKLYGYLNCDLLIVDDLGSEKSGEWQDQELFHLFDFRMCNGKITIVTSNLPKSELKHDGRIIDRLNRMCLSVQLPEISIRTKKAQRDDEQFVKRILNDNQ